MADKVSADDIPTTVTKLVYTAPEIKTPLFAVKLSQNDVAKQFTHYWPAIEEHFRELIASELESADASANGPLEPSYEGPNVALDAVVRIIRKEQS